MRHDNTVPARIEWAPAAVPTASQDSGQDKMKRYEKFADEIAELIRTGVLAPGQKVPSVRHASRTYGVSASTVFQAYYLLESRGLIMARARSGYFVCQHVQRPLPEPEISPRQADATEVDVSELVFSVLSSIKDPDTVPFGSAFPSPQLFPLPRLARSMAHAVRDMDPQSVVADMTPRNHGLRRQIALRYMVGGLLLPVEELVISNGALEALNLCLQVVTRPGDLVAIEAPAFYATLQVLERLKLKAAEIPVHPREGIDLEVLADMTDLVDLARVAAEQIERLKLMTSLSASIPAQAAIADYLQHGGYDRHLRKLRYALETQQNAMLAAVARYFPEQTRVSRPSGGYFLWLELPEAVDSLRLFQLALAQGISLAPGPIFSATRRFAHCARLNYGHPWSARQEKAMETLGRIAQSLAG